MDHKSFCNIALVFLHAEVINRVLPNKLSGFDLTEHFAIENQALRFVCLGETNNPKVLLVDHSSLDCGSWGYIPLHAMRGYPQLPHEKQVEA